MRIPKLDEADPDISEGGVVVWRGGAPAADRSGILRARDEPESVAFDVGSGDYAFTRGGPG